MKTLLKLFAILFVLLVVTSCELFFEVEQGKMHILVYGNDYANLEGNQLYGTVNDALQVGNVLAKYAGKNNIDYDITYMLSAERTTTGNGSGARPVYGEPLDSPRSRVHDDLAKETYDAGELSSGFRYVLQEIASESSDNDTTIIYYAGHGQRKASSTDLESTENIEMNYGDDNAPYASFYMGNSNAIIGYPGAQIKDYRDYRFDEFLEDISAIKGTKVIIADCCFSGGLINGDNFTNEYVMGEKTGLSLGNLSFYSHDLISYLYEDKSLLEIYLEGGKVKDIPDTYILAASQYYRVSEEAYGRTHGYFTGIMLDCLGWNEPSQTIGKASAETPSGMITLGSLATAVREGEGLPTQYGDAELTEVTQWGQKSVVSSGSMDVVLFR